MYIFKDSKGKRKKMRDYCIFYTPGISHTHIIHHSLVVHNNTEKFWCLVLIFFFLNVVIYGKYTGGDTSIDR